MADIIDLKKDSRVCTSLRHLVSLKEHSHGFSFLPKHIATSRLSGRHGSKFRGRGINFEELRAYRVGDDVKNIDWKITLKTGTPHIRAYSEEKDHGVILVVDQTQSMFFSSVDTMKSVVAAEIAALCAWRSLADNDRVGAIALTETGHHWFSPRRGENNAMRMLGSISEGNEALISSESGYDHTEDKKLSKAIEMIFNRGMRDSVIIFISDFYNLSCDTLDKLKLLQVKNDVLCVQISDPLEVSWAEDVGMVFSDGNYQINVSGEEKKISSYFSEEHGRKKASLSSVLQVKGLPLIELDTSGDHIKQFITQLSGVQS